MKHDIFPWCLQERFLLKQAEAKQAQQTLHHHSQQSEQLLVKSAAKLGELYQQLAEVGWQQQQQQQQQPCGAAPSTASGKHVASLNVPLTLPPTPPWGLGCHWSIDTYQGPAMTHAFHRRFSLSSLSVAYLHLTSCHRPLHSANKRCVQTMSSAECVYKLIALWTCSSSLHEDTFSLD